ncbi:MAG: hypothetical protein QM768_21705 [Agriterribacter sp.]
MLNDITLMNGTDNMIWTMLTSSAEVTLASQTVTPGSWQAKMTTVSAGMLCLTSSDTKGPIGLLTKMLLAQSVTWYSTKRNLIWRKLVTPHKAILYRLLPVEAPISETEYSLLPTPMYKDGESYYVLTMEQSLKRASRQYHWGHKAMLFYNLKKGFLNPRFSLWLMGYPTTYLDLEPQATQSMLPFQ